MSLAWSFYIATVLEHASPYDFAETEQDAEPEVGPSHLFPPSWWPITSAGTVMVAHPARLRVGRSAGMQRSTLVFAAAPGRVIWWRSEAAAPGAAARTCA